MTTAEEKVEFYKAKINALKQEQKKQQKIVNEKKRKARNKRLIETGVIIEKFFGAEINLNKMSDYLSRRADYIKQDVVKLDQASQMPNNQSIIQSDGRMDE